MKPSEAPETPETQPCNATEGCDGIMRKVEDNVMLMSYPPPKEMVVVLSSM